jgi:Zn-dependent peptidase ImmA (M78 family)
LIEEHDDICTLPNAPRDQGRLSGMLDPDEGVIWVDRREASRAPRRKRFTVAHELGHARLHLTAEMRVFVDRPEDINELPVEGFGGGVPDLGTREREADEFARELLMPELLVTAQARDTGFNLAALADRFDVSVPAIRLRLRLLGLLPKYMA